MARRRGAAAGSAGGGSRAGEVRRPERRPAAAPVTGAEGDGGKRRRAAGRAGWASGASLGPPGPGADDVGAMGRGHVAEAGGGGRCPALGRTCPSVRGGFFF